MTPQTEGKRTLMAVLPALALGVLTLGLARAQAVPQGDPAAWTLLQKTMVRYHNLKSYRSQSVWKMEIDGRAAAEAQKRTLAYVKPNKFKIVSAGSLRNTAVSDGKAFVEYSSSPDVPATRATAPQSLEGARSMATSHFMFGGSPLFRFFGGPDALQTLADANKPIAFDKDVTLSGVLCRVVSFFEPKMYGLTRVAIGKSDGLVRRISYDGAPLVAAMRERAGQMPPGAKLPQRLTGIETYTSVRANASIAASEFSTVIPKNLPVQDETEADKPPVPLGQPAPDVAVQPIGGGPKVKLSELKGRVVLIDFWATWCPPCRESLPETQKLHQQFGDKGLSVLAVTAEEAGTVKPFLQDNKYTFPAYLDEGNKAAETFKVRGIPTFAVIDRNGKLSAFLVGLHPPGVVLAALKKAGLQTN